MSKDNLGNIIANTATDRINEYLTKVDNVLNNMPTGNKIKLSPENSLYIEVDKNELLLCDKIEEMLKWTDWSTELVSVFSEFPTHLALLITEITGESYEYVMNKANEGIEYLISWINDKISKGLNIISKKLKKIYKKFLLISAKVNRALKIAQRAAYKIMKNVLQKIASGKLLNSTLSFVNKIIAAFNALATILGTAIEYIMSIIKLLPIMLQLDGELMGFFITPKSLKTITLIPVNDQISIFSGLANEIFFMINQYISGIKISQKNANIIKISTTAAAATVNTFIPDMPSFDLETLTPEKLHQKVNQILSLFIQSEPLPEFKKLKLTNIGFQIWLNTSFELGMKQSFGIPGMP